jgi:hypothetical protein
MNTILNIIEKHVQLNQIDDIVIVFYWDVIFKLIRESREKIETQILERLVDLTLKTMEFFSNQQTVQTIALLILLNNHILENISFDRYKSIHLVMNSLINFKDKNMNRKAVWITSKLIRKISNEEKSNLFSNPIYVKTLLNIVESHT